MILKDTRSKKEIEFSSKFYQTARSCYFSYVLLHETFCLWMLFVFHTCQGIATYRVSFCGDCSLDYVSPWNSSPLLFAVQLSRKRFQLLFVSIVSSNGVLGFHLSKCMFDQTLLSLHDRRLCTSYWNSLPDTVLRSLVHQIHFPNRCKSWTNRTISNFCLKAVKYRFWTVERKRENQSNLIAGKMKINL